MELTLAACDNTKGLLARMAAKIAFPLRCAL